MLLVVCPRCGMRAEVPDAAVGARGKCRRCGCEVRVPQDAPHLPDRKPAAAATIACRAHHASAPTTTPAAEVMTCPICQEMFPIDAMDASGVCVRCANNKVSDRAGTASDEKACPYCGEMIKAVARKCRFCGEMLRSSPQRAEQHAAHRMRATPPRVDNTESEELEERRVTNASRNCIAFFVVLVFYLLAVATFPQQQLRAGKGGLLRAGPGLFVQFLAALAAVGGAVFSAIYVPLRWNYIMCLHPVIIVLGLLGASGLVILTVIGLLGTCVGPCVIGIAVLF